MAGITMLVGAALTGVALVMLDIATEEAGVVDNKAEGFTELEKVTIDGEATTTELVATVLTTDEVARFTELAIDFDEERMTVSL